MENNKPQLQTLRTLENTSSGQHVVHACDPGSQEAQEGGSRLNLPHAK